MIESIFSPLLLLRMKSPASRLTILTILDRQVRFSDSVDDESERFESELLATGIELALPQRILHLREYPGEYRLLQIRGVNGQACAQLVAYIRRPRLFKKYGHAVVPQLGKAIDAVEEQMSIAIIQELLRRQGDILTLRLQPERLDPIDLRNFEARARREGYELRDPIAVTRTLLVDLKPSLDETLKSYSKKTRAKICSKGRDILEIRPIHDLSYIPRCNEAMNASFSRTKGGITFFDFNSTFSIAQKYPKNAIVFGLFLKKNPDVLMSYSVAFCHGKLAEYSSSGSFFDAELRAVPFNYFMIWELMAWAKASGAEWFNLGGVSEGGPLDPLKGISEFKRHLSENEVETGREMVIILKPILNKWTEQMSNTVKYARSLLSTEQVMTKKQLIRSWATVVFLFLALAAPLSKVGKPTSPAVVALEALGSQKLDIAFVGDSRTHAGISPTTLMQALDQSGVPGVIAHNFGVDGTDVLHHHSFTVQSLLKMKTLPKIIVWSPDPLGFNRNRLGNRLEMLSYRDLPSLVGVGAPKELVLDIATMAFFPPYRHRPILARTISDKVEILGKKSIPLQRGLLGLSFTPEVISRQYFKQSDGQEYFKILDWSDRFKRGADAYIVDYGKLKISDWHLKLGQDLMRRVRESGSKLVVIELPFAPFFQANLENSEVHLAWRQEMKKMAAQERALFWQHTDRYRSDQDFGDPSHMSEETSKDYSRYLAYLIQEDPDLRSALAAQKAVANAF